MHPPGGKVDRKALSARVTGRYTSEATDRYRFGLHVAGALVADAWDGRSKGWIFFEEGNDEITGDVELEAVRVVDLRLGLRTTPSASPATRAASAISAPLRGAKRRIGRR